MTPATKLLFALAILLAALTIVTLVDRWRQRRRRMLDRAFGNDDGRAIDVLKRGEICPWPRDV